MAIFKINHFNLEVLLKSYEDLYGWELTLVERSIASPKSKPALYLTPEDYIVQKRYGHLMLQSLLALSKNPAVPEPIRSALNQVMVFGRDPHNPLTETYSRIQSILIPGLFYLELGNFHIMVGKGLSGHRSIDVNQLPLHGLNKLGIIPMTSSVMKGLDYLIIRPAGSTSLFDPTFTIEKDYMLNLKEYPPLLTPEVLKLFKETLMKIFHETSMPESQSLNVQKIKEKLNSRINDLIKALNPFEQELASRKTDDLDENIPWDSSTSFFNLKRDVQDKDEEITDYERIKKGVDK